MGSDSISCPGHRHWSASSADRFPESCGRVAPSIGASGASAGLGSDPVRYLCAKVRCAATPAGLPLQPLRRVVSNDRRAEIGAFLSATKILWGQIVVVSVIVLAGIWGATQWTAWRLAYQPRLGQPWVELGGMPVYPPPAFFVWWYWFDAYAPRIFVEGAIIASSGGFAAIAIAIGMSVWRAREVKEATTYGSARWATASEIRKAGFLKADGVVLGCFGREYLRHDGPEHVLCFAPTRSGKGVGLVVPTLLTWPGSAIVHDIKGENWQLTAGWRARFARVLLFDPTNAESSAYNPLLEVRRGD